MIFFSRRKRALIQSKFYIRILQLLGVFGAGFLFSCEYGYYQPDYGVPWEGDHEIRFYGNVKSADSLKNIPGIQVELVDNYNDDTLVTATGPDGNYVLYHYAWEEHAFTLKFTDMDSTENLGIFQGKTYEITISGRDFNNSERETDVKLNKL